jgi:hypothetical protein
MPRISLLESAVKYTLEEPARERVEEAAPFEEADRALLDERRLDGDLAGSNRLRRSGKRVLRSEGSCATSRSLLCKARSATSAARRSSIRVLVSFYQAHVAAGTDLFLSGVAVSGFEHTLPSKSPRTCRCPLPAPEMPLAYRSRKSYY